MNSDSNVTGGVKIKKDFSPTKLSKYFWAFSLTILLAGILVVSIWGFNLGMDFTGGNLNDVQVGEKMSEDGVYEDVTATINRVLSEHGLKASQLQRKGDGAESAVEFQYQNKAGLDNEEMNALNLTIQQELTEAFADQGFTVGTAQTKGPSASAELLMNALLAVVIALICILIYIAIRFEFLSGISAIITLAHDVLLMCAFVAIFRIEINSAFIAAIITILGYSVNNTIIIFDRVRENLKKDTLKGYSNTQIADMSIKQTLPRTLNTSITTILAIFLLAIIGVPSMREFVIPILIGLLIGTYASIFISAPLWTKLMSKSRLNSRKKISTREAGETNVVDAVATRVEE